MVRPILACLLVTFAMTGIPAAEDAAPNGLERSVVRIVNFSQHGDWYSPWDVSGVVQSSGSGFVIDGGLVMTNAHVVSDARLLVLFAHNDPNPHEAEVLHVAHDCDLALIRPVDPATLDGVPPLPFGELPRLGSTVYTLGYPAGGTRMSSTRGVVSRIEEQLYLHSGKDLHLTVQTDAAINPGNSGGPVVQGVTVVGVAFQANLELEGVGFFIPVEVTGRFLHDVDDGRYDGYPDLGILTEGLANPAARARFGMTEDETGVRVNRVYRGASADGRLRAGDVILSIDGRPVANDGTVADGTVRFDFGLLVDRAQMGERTTIRILRGGERTEVVLPLTGFPGGENRGHRYDESPRYYVYGGLVFVPLQLETLKTFGPDWRARASKDMLFQFLVRPLIEPDLAGSERVVLLRRLDHPVNADMSWYRNQVVERVNGRRITNLEDLVDTLENHDGEFHLIEFSDFRRIAVLDRAAVKAVNAEILQRYGIQKDRNL